MRNLIFGLGVIFGLVSAQAQASVSYVFTQTTTDAFNDVQIQIEYTVADTGAQASYNFGQFLSGSLGGLLNFKFTGGLHKTITLDTLKVGIADCEDGLCFSPPFSFSFDFHDGFASMNFLDLEDQFSFTGFPTAHVSANTDNGGCFITGACQIDGYWTQVPEPASLALIGMGLVGLAAVRTRRARPTLAA